jgi:hypothetical protein
MITARADTWVGPYIWLNYLSSPFINFFAQSSPQKWYVRPPSRFSTERDSGT